MTRRAKPAGRKGVFKGTQQDLIKLLQRQGVKVEVSGGGHYKVHCPKGVVFMSRTPSERGVGKYNIKILREYGVEVDY